MKFRLEIECDNAAFGEDQESIEAEVARILGDVADSVLHGRSISQQNLRDGNGNTVGMMEWIT